MQMREHCMSLIRWKKCTAILTLILAGFIIQSLLPSKASALLKEIVEPVLSTKPLNKESSDHNVTQQNEEKSGSLLTVPSIKVDTPVLKVETPNISVNPDLNQGSLNVDVSSTKVEAPLVQSEISDISAGVKADKSVVPEVEVKAPSVKAETPLARVETSSVEAKTDSSNDGVIPKVHVQAPSVSVQTPVVSVETKPVQTKVSPRRDALPDVKVSVPVAENPKTQEPVEVKKPTTAESNPNANLDQVGTNKSFEDASNTSQPVIDLVTVEPVKPLEDEKSSKADLTPVNERSDVEEQETDKPEQIAKDNLVTEDKLVNDEILSDKAVLSDQLSVRSNLANISNPAASVEKGEPTASPSTTKQRLPMTSTWSSNGIVAVPVNVMNGTSAPGSPSSGVNGNAGLHSVISDFSDVKSLGFDKNIMILRSMYILGSDQWSQPPPGQPPMHTLLSTVENKKFN
ncbi:hypothetical protein [Paenibacillus lemnae]|uniref:Uncharacterized protein n=1 Tax=Paenibacillus lemnae TaxID=1330551 RepID=A0A848MCG8_PAELE|nr:hypothetical protein [Paenibacillus lemnae]NMO97830.1 hypothetical protein [Paenibacillus lemnae]